jgi:hypothetical protein
VVEQRQQVDRKMPTLAIPGLSQQQPSSVLPPPSNVMPIALPSMPSLPAPTPPNVQGPPPPTPSQLMLDSAKRDQMVNSGSGISQIKNPILRGLATAADITGSIFVPRLDSMIPGTQLHHQVLVHQQNGLIAQDQAQQAADTAQQTAQAELRQHQAAATLGEAQVADLSKPQATDYDYVDTPGGKVAIAKGTTTGVPVTVNGQPIAAKEAAPTNAFELWHQQNPNGTVSDYNNLESKPLTQQDADSLNGIFNPLAGKHGLPTNQFQPGMAHADALQIQGALNQAVGKQQGDVHISIAQQGQAERANALATKGADVDVSSPDAIASLTAVAHGAAPITTLLPRGATVQQRQGVMAALLRINPNFNSGLASSISGTENDAAHGAMAKNLTAIRTANNHLGQLGDAAVALQNGNVQALNKIGNAYNVQMGGSAATNFSTVKNAVAGELAKALTGTATVDEIHQMNTDISSAQSPQQIAGVVKTYQGLMQSKAHNLQTQYENGKSGSIDFSLGNGSASGPKAGDVESGYRFKGGNPASQSSWEKVQ